MARVEGHTGGAQARQPGMQERGGLHADREHPPGGADKGLDAEFARPLAHLFGAEFLQQGFQLRPARAVAGQKLFERFGMGQVQAALAGHQELASHGGFGFVQVDPQAGLDQHFGGHQPGRPAAEDDCRLVCAVHSLRFPIILPA